MNAFRTLPILNRPSRPSSPAPPTVQSTTASGTASQPSFDAKPRSRSLSRQVADKVSSLQLTNTAQVNGSTIVTSQPIGGKKGASPPGSRPVTPRTAQSPLPMATVPNGSAGDVVAPQSGYMDVIGLRLNEVVNRACAGVEYKAKKGFKKGNGWIVGEGVVKELPSPTSDAYLMRAVLRTATRSLSIYITRLESMLLPALTDSSFASSLNVTALSPSAHSLNPNQYFAVSVAHAAWETCEVLEQTLETGRWPRFVQETLRPVMDKLDLVVSRVIQPLLLGLKRDLIASLSRTEGTSPPGGKVVGLSTVPAPTTVPSATSLALGKELSDPPVSRLTKPVSQGGTARQLAIPVCLQHFASRIDGSRKVFDLIAKPCADDGETWVTGVVVATIWRGMCILSEKDLLSAPNRPPSPSSVARALAGIGKEKTAAPAVPPSPSLTGVTAKLTSSLSIIPSRAQSRSSSPPRTASKVNPATHALMSFESLVKRLVNGLVQPPTLPTGSVIDPNDTEHLAREALHEAQEALMSFRIVSNAMHSGVTPSSRLLASARRLRDDLDDPVEETLDDALEDLPAITLFTILIRQVNSSLSTFSALHGVDEKRAEWRIRTATEIWGWNNAEYERQALSGFGAAEEWGRRVALAIKGDLEKVLSSLVSEAGSGIEKPSRELLDATEWVRVLGVVSEARCGVKVAGAT